MFRFHSQYLKSILLWHILAPLWYLYERKYLFFRALAIRGGFNAVEFGPQVSCSCIHVKFECVKADSCMLLLQKASKMSSDACCTPSYMHGMPNVYFKAFFLSCETCSVSDQIRPMLTYSVSSQKMKTTKPCVEKGSIWHTSFFSMFHRKNKSKRRRMLIQLNNISRMSIMKITQNV